MAAIDYLSQFGLSVALAEGKLRVTPAHLITDTVRQYVRDHRDELLTEAANDPPPEALAWLDRVARLLGCSADYLLNRGFIERCDLAELYPIHPARVVTLIRSNPYWAAPAEMPSKPSTSTQLPATKAVGKSKPQIEDGRSEMSETFPASTQPSLMDESRGEVTKPTGVSAKAMHYGKTVVNNSDVSLGNPSFGYHLGQPQYPVNTAATASTEWIAARDHYLSHIMSCPACYAPTGRHCIAGADLRASYDHTPMEAHP